MGSHVPDKLSSATKTPGASPAPPQSGSMDRGSHRPRHRPRGPPGNESGDQEIRLVVRHRPQALQESCECHRPLSGTMRSSLLSWTVWWPDHLSLDSRAGQLPPRTLLEADLFLSQDFLLPRSTGTSFTLVLASSQAYQRFYPRMGSCPSQLWCGFFCSHLVASFPELPRPLLGAGWLGRAHLLTGRNLPLTCQVWPKDPQARQDSASPVPETPQCEETLMAGCSFPHPAEQEPGDSWCL